MKLKISSLLLFLIFSWNIWADSTVEILYWPNVNMGLGHISVRVQNEDKKIYLSYAMGNLLQNDHDKYGESYKTLSLPNIKDEKLDKFLMWFNDSYYSKPKSEQYRNNYSLLRNNCAHAVLRAMKALGYNITRNSNRFALRPSQVYREGIKINNQD